MSCSASRLHHKPRLKITFSSFLKDNCPHSGMLVHGPKATRRPPGQESDKSSDNRILIQPPATFDHGHAT